MNTALELGPVFAAVKRQSPPDRMITDLGITMSWGNPMKRHQARLYWNAREHAPKSCAFEQVVLHEEDCPDVFAYQPSLARKTPIGTFYPLTAYLRHLYILGDVNRDVFQALAELGRLLPKSSVTRHTGRLHADLEIGGFNITSVIQEADRVMVCVNWMDGEGRHSFFVGIMELKPTTQDPSGQWILPGQVGVNHLLMARFEKVCDCLSDCLTPEFRQQIQRSF